MSNRVVFLILSCAVFTGGLVIGRQATRPQTFDIYQLFVQENLNLIKNEYWQVVPEEKLITDAQRFLEKKQGHAVALKQKTIAEFVRVVGHEIKSLEPGAKKQRVVEFTDGFLRSLSPGDRSRLYAPKDVKDLQQQITATGTAKAQNLHPKMHYLRIKSYSPQTYDELKIRAEGDLNQGVEVDTLIIDLRDNVGGYIDVLPSFLGPFIGPDQYAYEFFRRGKREVYKTRTGWLSSFVKYKKVVVLINHGTQSTAELTASVFKKYNVGVLVGTRTRGWGSIEKVYALQNQIDPAESFSVFLVNNLSVREDGLPLQGNGVHPHIAMQAGNWGEQLNAYFNYPDLVKVVAELWAQPPRD